MLKEINLYIIVLITICFIHHSFINYLEDYNSNSKYFDYVKKNINCHNVYYRMLSRKNSNSWPPPKTPPSYLYNNFTQDGDMPIKSIYYFKQRYAGCNAEFSQWNISLIKELQNKHKQHKQISGYTLYEESLIDEAITRFSVRNKDVAVIGSEYPWIEAIISTKTPKSITTIEYGKINSSVPFIKTYIPKQFAKLAIQSNIQFDYVVSYSSLEHSGLGRYGDLLNPNGDIEAAEEVWCMLKKGGYFLIGLPYSNKSYIRWNADRNYGPERMKYFAANFKQIQFFGKAWSGQIPLLLRK